MRRGRMTFKCLSFLLVVLVILCIFGYGLLSTDVVNNKKDEMLWDVSFKDLSIVEGSVDAIVPAEVSRTGTEVNYIANLINVDDYYKFEVDIVNNGEFDAKVASIFKDSLDYNQQKYHYNKNNIRQQNKVHFTTYLLKKKRYSCKLLARIPANYYYIYFS